MTNIVRCDSSIPASWVTLSSDAVCSHYWLDSCRSVFSDELLASVDFSATVSRTCQNTSRTNSGTVSTLKGEILPLSLSLSFLQQIHIVAGVKSFDHFAFLCRFCIIHLASNGLSCRTLAVKHKLGCILQSYILYKSIFRSLG